MSPFAIKQSCQSTLTAFVNEHSDEATRLDLLRLIRDEARIAYETEHLRSTLMGDPMGLASEAPSLTTSWNRLIGQLSVLDHHKVITGGPAGNSYCSITSLVEWNSSSSTSMRLEFSYERHAHGDGTHINYSIKMGKEYGERRSLLAVQVWAMGEGPSMEQAILVEDDDDEWEDMDDDEQDGMQDVAKEEENEDRDIKIDNTDKIPTSAGSSDMDATKEEGSRDHDRSAAECGRDRFAAFMDPDVVQELLNECQQPWDDSQTMFALMAFPYWEHEWDLVGLLLQAVFETEDDDGEDEQN